MNSRSYFVYLMANESRMIYVGMTNSLLHRVHQHKAKQIEGFTKRYNMTKLVHWEETSEVGKAIEREKELKRWGRSKKVALIERENPKWQDLAMDWYSEPERSRVVAAKDPSAANAPQDDNKRGSTPQDQDGVENDDGGLATDPNGLG